MFASPQCAAGRDRVPVWMSAGCLGGRVKLRLQQNSSLSKFLHASSSRVRPSEPVLQVLLQVAAGECNRSVQTEQRSHEMIGDQIKSNVCSTQSHIKMKII